jgi:hypothetical protein
MLKIHKNAPNKYFRRITKYFITTRNHTFVGFLKIPEAKIIWQTCFYFITSFRKITVDKPESIKTEIFQNQKMITFLYTRIPMVERLNNWWNFCKTCEIRLKQRKGYVTRN